LLLSQALDDFRCKLAELGVFSRDVQVTSELLPHWLRLFLIFLRKPELFCEITPHAWSRLGLVAHIIVVASGDILAELE